MNPKRTKKLISISLILLLLSVATALILFALRQNINLFYTPTELKNLKHPPQQSLRMGGYVKNHSVHYSTDGSQVEFIITDRKNEFKVYFSGILPNLFREGQTVIVTGQVSGGTNLIASAVLAKHDEKYIPKNLVKPLKEDSNHVS